MHIYLDTYAHLRNIHVCVHVCTFNPKCHKESKEIFQPRLKVKKAYDSLDLIDCTKGSHHVGKRLNKFVRNKFIC